MSQNGPQTTSLMMTLTKKSATPNQKFFLQVQTIRLAQSFEGLNSSSAIGGGAVVLLRQPKTAGFGPKYIRRQVLSVKGTAFC